MTDESFEIKSLGDLLDDNGLLRHQNLLKQNVYGFMLRLLEENKDLVERLADCQRCCRNLEDESRRERRHKDKYHKELSEWKMKYDSLKEVNAVLNAKLVKKRKS